MKTYKICPFCNEKNDVDALECIHDGTDLTNVSITTESDNKPIPPKMKEKNDCIGKLCECGKINPPNARKCISCGEDIFQIPITEIKLDDMSSRKFSLVCEDDHYDFVIKQGKTILGRQYEMQTYLQNKMFVGRKHAEILLENNFLKIKNLNQTNYTFVNNVKIDDEEYTELKDGDILSLGGILINGAKQDKAAYFQVRIV